MIKGRKSGSNQGGSAEGWIETMKRLLALNANTYVPGHGPLQTKADVQQNPLFWRRGGREHSIHPNCAKLAACER